MNDFTQNANADTPLDIHALIQNGGVETHFQPITSIRKCQIIGLEALSRGVGNALDGQAPIAPDTMFKLAEAEQVAPALDDLCRQTAMKSFSPLHGSNRDLLLFLNFHALSLNNDIESENGLLASVAALGLDPRNIVIEILESEFDDTDELRLSVDIYKKHGFLMALDDLGAGFSNLDRIAFIKPDILKLDRVLVRDLDKDYHKQEVFKSLVNLSEKIGGWTVVEGVETQDEAMAALDLGADMMQGYYFARPHKIENSEIQLAQERVTETALRFRSHVLEQVRSKQDCHEKRLAAVRGILQSLESLAPQNFDAKLSAAMAPFPAVQSASVLDENGLQITATTENPHRQQKQKSIIFKAPDKGSDHSLKEYFYLLQGAGLDFYTTQPYVPLPSGDLCVTVSTLFCGEDGSRFVLCVHIEAPQLMAEMATQNFQH